ncbi:ribonuclease H-like protein [Leucogyrophana mollusca]|uniref:Ribonuclease H-like protein n=1 Tax=Leucogyrophana mollusca TaxID=85980 RepID=A0ACB8BBM5_9AGAM|nr:ribonuclease H-like protein [Leucogyrophana mollusca]
MCPLLMALSFFSPITIASRGPIFKRTISSFLMSKTHLELEEPRKQGIFGRKMVFCPLHQANESVDGLIVTCPTCLRLFARCCPECGNSDRTYLLVHTDGSCIQNKEPAMAGIGVAVGLHGSDAQWAMPVDDIADPGGARTNQRAELLAALEGVRRLSDLGDAGTGQTHQCIGRLGSTVDSPAISWVIATDSLYVVTGITKSMPVWKVRRFPDCTQSGPLITKQTNGWITKTGSAPVNLDLFQKLDEQIIWSEGQHNVEIGFWHVKNKYNKLADSLAKGAARTASPSE